MKTETWIDMLAQGAGPAPHGQVMRRLVPVALLGLLFSAAVSLAVLGPVPAAMFQTPVPWMKLAYAGALAGAAGWLSAGLARPVARLRTPTHAVLAVFAVMTLLGGLAWWLTPTDDRLVDLMGHSWSTCPVSVLLLSLPSLAGGLWALRGLAPTRPRAAGLAVGLLAGALGAMGYALACVETSPAFVALWYTLGMVLSGALGAWLGPRVLRW